MTLIRFETSDGLTLEGELRHPQREARGSAVLCHPLPTQGGSRDHPLLWAIRNDLAGNRGLVVLAFNFRGVMGSEGSFGHGVDEVQDVAAAAARVREEANGPTAIAGWSFGANVALRHAASGGDAAALVLIGIPLDGSGPVLPPLPGRAELKELSIPVLLVVGAADPFSPVPAVKALARKFSNAEALVVPDTDHFFLRREREVAEAIGEFVDRVL